MTGISRRSFVAGLAGATAGLGGAMDAVALPDTAGLRDRAARAGMVFGSAATAENLEEPDLGALYAREAGTVTSDLELKFASLRPDRDTFDFNGADRLIAWAERHAMPVRGHTLAWNEYNPEWLNRCSAREIERIFDEHIERVVSRYAGRIQTWDVVNEPFWPDHGAPGGYRRGPWFDALGPGYIPRALRRVRAIDKTARLCVNEAHVDSDNSWGVAIRPCFARLFETLRHDGVPIDVAGVQCHLHPAWPHDYGAFADYCAAIARNRVDLHITEFDVNDESFPDAVAVRDTMVAAVARDFLRPMLAIPALTTLVTWELSDRSSFYWHAVHDAHPLAARLPRPLPFDEALRRKPLWTALADGFERRAASLP